MPCVCVGAHGWSRALRSGGVHGLAVPDQSTNPDCSRLWWASGHAIERGSTHRARRTCLGWIDLSHQLTAGQRTSQRASLRLENETVRSLRAATSTWLTAANCEAGRLLCQALACTASRVAHVRMRRQELPRPHRRLQHLAKKVSAGDSSSSRRWGRDQDQHGRGRPHTSTQLHALPQAASPGLDGQVRRRRCLLSADSAREQVGT